MEIGLDILLAAANRAGQACDYKLGNCSRTLHLGLFFDGVGRNIEQDAPENRLSNIAKLFRAYPTPDQDTSTKTHKKHYISGIGTPFNETLVEKLQGLMDASLSSIGDDVNNFPTDQLKDGAAAILTGSSVKDAIKGIGDSLLTPKGRIETLRDIGINATVRPIIEATPVLRDSDILAYNYVFGDRTRINSLKKRFTEIYEEAKSSGEIPIRLISVSLFGYDTGAALAREFIDILLDEICIFNEDKKQHEWRDIPVNIAFVGLFDCSRDTPDSSDDGLQYLSDLVQYFGYTGLVASTLIPFFGGRKYLEYKSPLPTAVRKSLHLVAAHERRLWRCLYRTGLNNENHIEELIPGCSDDIGGGLISKEQKPSNELSKVALHRMYEEAFIAGIPFPHISELENKDKTIWSYFAFDDQLGGKSTKRWVAEYQKCLPYKSLSYVSRNSHLDSYIEWLGKQYYEYRARKVELEKESEDLRGKLYSGGEAMGFAGISPKARQMQDEIMQKQRLLQKHWGWLDQVRDAADDLQFRLTKHPHDTRRNIPALMNKIYMPALKRANYFLACGINGHMGKPQPPTYSVAPKEMYAYFIHDIQTQRNSSEKITEAFFCIRGIEPNIERTFTKDS
ncbi:DUF2235 domain-containing protein [Providencia rettgeri]|nr:DUF2235 domain-containing protein [Providencia rettgeri]